MNLYLRSGMTPAGVSLSSAILLVVWNSCVRAYNFPSYGLEHQEQNFNSYCNLPIHIEPPLLLRKLCLHYKWLECLIRMRSGAKARNRDSYVQRRYQTASYEYLGGSTKRPEFKIRTSQPHRPLLGNENAERYNHHKHNFFPISSTISLYRKTTNKAPFEFTQPATKPCYRSPQNSKNNEHFLDVVQNQSTTAKTHNYNNVTKSTIKDTKIQNISKPMKKSDLEISTVLNKTDLAMEPDNPITDVTTEQDKPRTDVTTDSDKPKTNVTTEPHKSKTDVTIEPEKPKKDVMTQPDKPKTDVITESNKPKTNVTTEPDQPTNNVITEPDKLKTGVKNEPDKPNTEVTTEPVKPKILATRSMVDTIIDFDDTFFDKFKRALDNFERKFYEATFSKLSSISPTNRRENGISFIQSGLLMYLMLTALSLEVDPEAKLEIQDCIGINASNTEMLHIINQVMTTLPESSDDLRFRLKSRLIMAANLSYEMRNETASSVQLQLGRFNVTDTYEELAKKLNHMVEADSGGAMHNTFDESDLMEGVSAVLMSTVFVRARWRSAPTLLNGTRSFRDAEGAPKRTVRMLRINDVMRYADLKEFDAEAIEISYATPNLSLVLLVPRGRSLRKLSERMFKTPIQNIIDVMQTMRLAVSMPLYTLRMTLLLPNKLHSMGLSRIVDTSNDTSNGTLRLSHAIQRLMFWAEAGRNAFKDDGIEWDEHPELELMVDRPYLFFVRWKNYTLINGNFVL